MINSVALISWLSEDKLKKKKKKNLRKSAFQEGSFLLCFNLSFFRTRTILKQGVIELQLWQGISKKISLYYLKRAPIYFSFTHGFIFIHPHGKKI